jgi:hypothetical protein
VPFSFSEDEIFLLEIVLVPTTISILSVLLCERVLFGRKRWSTLSDTSKSLALFLPISMLIYMFFWAYLIQNSWTFVQRMTVAINIVGFVCSVSVLRSFLRGKRMDIMSNMSLIMGISLGFISSSLWMSTILMAIRGYESYLSYLSRTHILETGWTFVFWFGLLTPTLYVVAVIMKDPSFLFAEYSGIENRLNDIRSYLPLGFSMYSLLPLFGNVAFAPLGLGLSTINLFLFRVKNKKNYLASVLSVAGTAFFIWWFLY